MSRRQGRPGAGHLRSVELQEVATLAPRAGALDAPEPLVPDRAQGRRAVDHPAAGRAAVAHLGAGQAQGDHQLGAKERRPDLDIGFFIDDGASLQFLTETTLTKASGKYGQKLHIDVPELAQRVGATYNGLVSLKTTLKKNGTEIRSTPAGGVTTRCTVALR